MLKKLLSLLTVAVIFCFCFSANAETYSFKENFITADFSENYTVLLKNNLKRNEDVIKKIGHTTDSVSTFMQNNNIILIAVGTENKTQVQISCTETDFSKKAKSLSALSDEDIAAIGKKLYNNNFTIKHFNGIPFICNSSKNTVQYTTFEHEKTYTVTLYNFSENDSFDILNNIKIEKTSVGSSVTAYVVINSIILSAILIAAVTGIVLVTIRLVRQLKETNENDLEAAEIKIKRRKL